MASVLYVPSTVSTTRRNGFRRTRPAVVDREEQAVRSQPATSGAAVVIDAFDDFVHCTHPGCCALRPMGEGVSCPACRRL